MNLNFIKMNGTGNDFVIIDRREAEKTEEELNLTTEQIRALSSRSNDITKGCDQLIILESSTKADVFMRIYNADGGEVDACGNATRCVADMLYKNLARLPVTIETNAGILRGIKEINGYVWVDMGEPSFNWQDIPLAMPIEESTNKIIDFVNTPEIGVPIFVNIGNPHVVFFAEFNPLIEGINVSKLESLNIHEIGKSLELYKDVFPERVNVSIAILAKTIGDGYSYEIYATVWERGAGLTKACGTGACAMLAAANKYDSRVRDAKIRFARPDRDYNREQNVRVCLEGNNTIITGEVEKEFEGTVEI